jgi:tetratricopeptide (TPR) repeat protein
LSLCYLALKSDDGEIEKGMKWYMDRIDDYPENIGFLMGYANILNNKGIFEESIDYYNRVLDLKPKWVRPLECMAYIYEYKRVEKKKSCELANKILTLEPGNRVALFVLARNGSTADEKI